MTEDFWVNAGQKFKIDELLCPELILPDPQVGNRYLSCNPIFWECFWSKGIKKNPMLSFESEGQAFHLKSVKLDNGKFGKIITRSSLKTGSAPDWVFQVKIEVEEFPGQTLSLGLLNTCRDRFLPERVYAYGVSKTSRAEDVFLWDNFGRSIFVDRFPVSNREINDWAENNSKYMHLKVNEIKKWPYPAAHLSYKEQVQYCAEAGARLMEPLIFDAASLLPSSDIYQPEVVTASATPWERDRGRTFLSNETSPTVEDCKKAAVKGCKIYPYNTNSVSWMGMSDSLGFYPESFRSVYDRFNIKFSSIFIPADSSWSLLGKRGIWSGEGNKPQDFSTGSIDENPFLSFEDVPVSFRCYREGGQ